MSDFLSGTLAARAYDDCFEVEHSLRSVLGGLLPGLRFLRKRPGGRRISQILLTKAGSALSNRHTVKVFPGT